MMDEIDKKQLYHTAWVHWGGDAQIDMLIEEMAELTQALLKSRRNGVAFSYAVLEEFSDVEICMEQIKEKIHECGSGTPMEIIKQGKLERLYKRLMESMTQKYQDDSEE